MTIKINIELMGALKTPTGKRKFDFELEEGSTINHLLEKLKFTEEDRKYLLTYINSNHVKRDHVLEEGDEVFITALVGGG
ncbi:MAG: MoaD/ThiS family protein [Candidatus Hodarchaeales archaeon]|jgi:molybdopterin converting factor small subunit